MGRKLGDAADPLLVSVRSGAKFSMPGMMDTVLNLGLNDKSVKGLATVTGERAVRLRQLPPVHRDVRPDRARRRRRALRASARGGQGDGQRQDRRRAHRRGAEGAVRALQGGRASKETGKPFPQDPTRAAARRGRSGVQELERCPGDRLPGPRAHQPRPRHGRQRAGDGVRQPRRQLSGTGVGFTRNAATGENQPYGDFLINAQGEDVVAGIRNTEDLDELEASLPDDPRPS